MGTQAPYPLRHHQEGQGTKYRDVIHVQYLGGKPLKTPLGFDDALYGQVREVRALLNVVVRLFELSEVDSRTEQLYVCIGFQDLWPRSKATSYLSPIMQHVKVIL